MSLFEAAEIGFRMRIGQVRHENNENFAKCFNLLREVQNSEAAYLLKTEINEARNTLNGWRELSQTDRGKRTIHRRLGEYVDVIRKLAIRAEAYEAELHRKWQAELAAVEAEAARSAAEQALVAAEQARIEEERKAAEERIIKRRKEVDEQLRAHISGWKNRRMHNYARPYFADIKESAVEHDWSADRIASELDELYERLQKRFSSKTMQSQQQSGESESEHSAASAQAAADAIEDINAAPDGTDPGPDDDMPYEDDTADIETGPDGSEEDRRKIVRAVAKSLEDAGFAVSNPVLIEEDGKEVVLIQGARPAGNRAAFSISLDGTIKYKFDHYEGQGCRADIDKVIPTLQDIYGINLSNRRVLWSNPDDVFATSRPVAPVSQSQGGSGG